MDLNKIKKIEDLKIKANELQDVISIRNKQLKKNFIEKTKKDFKTYFEDKGFKVTSGEYSSSGKYGNYQIILEYSSENDSFIGCLAVYDLSINSKNYKIIINKIGSEIKITTTVRSVSKNEDEKLNIEIEDLEKNIASLESRIADKTEIKLGYMVRDENKTNYGEKYVESIGELIELIS